VRNVNISNTTIVNNTYITNVYENRVTNITYVNRNRPGAVVAVSQDAFTSGRSINGHTMRIPENELNRFGAHGAGPAIAPSRESVLGRRPDINVRRPPAAFLNRPVVARTAPPPAPVSFERQQAAIRANGGLPLARSQITALQAQAGAVNSRVRVVAPGPIRPIQNGQRFGTARPDQSIQDRERALHATPIPPSQQGAGQGFRNDRPATGQMRNDVRPTPQATPIAPQSRTFDQQQRSVEQSRPAEQPRTFEQSRPGEPSRQFNEPQRLEQPRAVAQPRPVPQATPIEQPRPVDRPQFTRPPEPSRPVQSQPQQQLQTRPEAHAIEQPHPAPQARPSPPPPAQHVEERRAGKPERPDPHN
jgi:hypothetical protein